MTPAAGLPGSSGLCQWAVSDVLTAAEEDSFAPGPAAWDEATQQLLVRSLVDGIPVGPLTVTDHVGGMVVADGRERVRAIRLFRSGVVGIPRTWLPPAWVPPEETLATSKTEIRFDALSPVGQGTFLGCLIDVRVLACDPSHSDALRARLNPTAPLRVNSDARPAAAGPQAMEPAATERHADLAV